MGHVTSGFDHELLSLRHGEPQVGYSPYPHFGCPVTPIPLIAGIAVLIHRPSTALCPQGEENVGGDT